MYKDLTQKQIEILSYLIKFYTSPQNDFLENKYGSYDFSITNQYFKENTEYFLNKKLGIDRIYHSLINAGYSFALQRSIVKSNFEHIKSINEEKNIFMAINEPFVNSLVLNFCIFNELINFKKKQIINSYYLNAKFNYLDKLNNRIQKSGLELIRNGWTAHPFEDKENGIVYKTKIVYENTLNVLSKICHEEDRKIFNESNDRIA
ncbi:hypothetical protein R8H71_000676 [Providencia rettgeri]|nr:hypothetical protein [Providencia rettgeri]